MRKILGRGSRICAPAAARPRSSSSSRCCLNVAATRQRAAVIVCARAALAVVEVPVTGFRDDASAAAASCGAALTDRTSGGSNAIVTMVDTFLSREEGKGRRGDPSQTVSADVNVDGASEAESDRDNVHKSPITLSYEENMKKLVNRLAFLFKKPIPDVAEGEEYFNTAEDLLNEFKVENATIKQLIEEVCDSVPDTRAIMKLLILHEGVQNCSYEDDEKRQRFLIPHEEVLSSLTEQEPATPEKPIPRPMTRISVEPPAGDILEIGVDQSRGTVSDVRGKVRGFELMIQHQQSTLGPQKSTLRPPPSTLGPQKSTLGPQKSTEQSQSPPSPLRETTTLQRGRGRSVAPDRVDGSVDDATRQSTHAAPLSWRELLSPQNDDYSSQLVPQRRGSASVDSRQGSNDSTKVSAHATLFADGTRPAPPPPALTRRNTISGADEKGRPSGSFPVGVGVGRNHSFSGADRNLDGEPRTAASRLFPSGNQPPPPTKPHSLTSVGSTNSLTSVGSVAEPQQSLRGTSTVDGRRGGGGGQTKQIPVDGQSVNHGLWNSPPSVGGKNEHQIYGTLRPPCQRRSRSMGGPPREDRSDLGSRRARDDEHQTYGTLRPPCQRRSSSTSGPPQGAHRPQQHQGEQQQLQQQLWEHLRQKLHDQQPLQPWEQQLLQRWKQQQQQKLLAQQQQKKLHEQQLFQRWKQQQKLLKQHQEGGFHLSPETVSRLPPAAMDVLARSDQKTYGPSLQSQPRTVEQQQQRQQQQRRGQQKQ